MRSANLVSLTALGAALVGCANTTTPPFDVGYRPGSDPDTAVEGNVDALEHCGRITADETWTTEFSPHVVTCAVLIENGATLTIAEGALVEFDTDGGIQVGVDGKPGGLVSGGSASGPVLLRAQERGASWTGIEVGGLADPVELWHTTLEGAGIDVTRATITLDHVDILDAPETGLLLDDAALSDASNTLLITGSGTYPVQIDAPFAHSLPTGDSLYVGNTTDRIAVDNLPMHLPATWSDPGVPWRVDGTLELAGSPWQPAVLTLGAGTRIIFPSGAGLSVAPGFNTSAGLVAEGTEQSPVELIADPLLPAGTWKGITVGAGALSSQVVLDHTLIDRAGSGNTNSAAISIVDNQLSARNLVVQGAPGPGIQLLGASTFSPDSADLTVRSSGYSMWLSPGAVASAPLSTLTREQNSDDHLLLDTSDWGTISGTLHLQDFGLPWRPNDSIVVRGTASAPARLEVDPGVDIELLPGDGVQVAYPSGAADVIMKGSASQPITFTGATAREPGSWVGLSIGPHCLADTTELDWVVVEYAGEGGGDDDANFTLDGCTPGSWGTLKVDHSQGWGAIFINTNTSTFGVFASSNGIGDVDCRGSSTSCD